MPCQLIRSKKRFKAMSSVYDYLGVPTIINAVGPSTRLSGGIMRLEVADAMSQASQYCVDIAILQSG